MQLNLTDIDTLYNKVIYSSSKIHFKESIITYRAGAHRASIISLWITVFVDIIEKIKVLSIDGDANATKIEEKLNNIHPTDVKGMLAFENDILKFACDDLEIISHIEKLHLEGSVRNSVSIR